MRASDLELPQGMEVYVDMDGVLADFFTEYAKLAGIKSGNYRDIPPAKTDPTLNKMVGTDFFARLPKFPTADKLIDIVVDVAGGYNICSSPLRGDHEGSEKYKRIWIDEHLNQLPDNIYIVSNKAKYARNPSGMPNVLIDDRGSNISAWEAAGGIGIKYQADEDSLQVILDGLKRAKRVGQGEEEHEPQQLKSLDRSQGKLIATSGDKDVDEGRKKKRRNKYGALYGPGPYGLYGTDAGYSGVGSVPAGDGGDGGGLMEAWTPDKKQRIKDFALWAIKLLEIEQAPRIKLVGDTKTTALGYFDPETQDIVVSVKDRHQMDIMRTLAHELVHRKQNEARELDGATGSPDENEANALAGVLLRYWGKMNPEQFNEHIVKVKRGYELKSKHGNKNLGKYPTRAGAEKRERQVQYFKHAEEDQHPNEKPRGPEIKPTMPRGTVRVDVSDVYDWYKLGKNIANLKNLSNKDFGKGPPSTIVSFGSEEEEHKYIAALKKLGLDTTDIDPVDPKRPKNMPRQKVDPTFNVDENFADGKNPQDKGDSKRHGITKGMSIAQLKKIRSSDSASPRKKQLAHWQINMRQGKKK